MKTEKELLISKQNKLLTLLILMNFIFIMIIFYLLFRVNQVSQVITSESALTQQVDEATATDSVAVNAVETTTNISEAAPPVEKRIASFVQAENVSESVNGTTDSGKNDSELTTTMEPEKVITVDVDTETTETSEPDKTNTVIVYNDGNLVRMEEIDSKGNQIITIGKSLENLGKLSSNDASYVKALEELRQGTRSKVTMSTTTVEEATTYQAEQSIEEQSVDYFNKIDVSKLNTQPVTDEPSLKTQIAQIVSEPENIIENENTISEVVEDSYIQELKAESVERANEMRTIQVARGDTLWDIAERAYGSGYHYPKIFEANPHLTNPNRIEIGDFLRVPL